MEVCKCLEKTPQQTQATDDPPVAKQGPSCIPQHYADACSQDIDDDDSERSPVHARGIRMRQCDTHRSE